MLKRVMVCVLGVIFCIAAHARPTTFTQKDHGLSDVVKRECGNSMWTSEVMRLTGIDSSELNSLKVGDTVVVPDNCATVKPSREIRRATLRILKQQKLLLQVEQTNKALLETANERNNWQTKANDLQQRNNWLSTERDSWRGKANGFEKENSELVQHKTSRWSFFWSSAIGCIVGTIFAYVVYWFQLHKLVTEKFKDLERIAELEEELRISNERQAELRGRLAALTSQETRTILATHFGEEIPFPITSKPRVTCPLCGEQNIIADEQHILGHLIKAHRLTKISPDEMRKELAQTD